MLVYWSDLIVSVKTAEEGRGPGEELSPGETVRVLLHLNFGCCLDILDISCQ